MNHLERILELAVCIVSLFLLIGLPLMAYSKDKILFNPKLFYCSIGPVKFENQFNIQSPGEVGQW